MSVITHLTHLPVTNISPTLLALTPEEAHMYEVFNPDSPSSERARYMSEHGYAFGIFPADDTYHSPDVPILATREDVPPRICDMLTRFYNNMGADGLAIEEDISDVERAARAMVWLAEREPNVKVAIRRDVMDYMHTK